MAKETHRPLDVKKVYEPQISRIHVDQDDELLKGLMFTVSFAVHICVDRNLWPFVFMTRVTSGPSP